MAREELLSPDDQPEDAGLLPDELRQRLGPQPGFVEQQAGILGLIVR